MMASHEPHHHLSGFSSSSPVTHNPAAMAMAFDHHGLFTPLHEDMPPRPGGDRPWPPQVSMLSLDDTASQHELQPFTVAPPSMMTMQQQSFWLNSSRYLGPARELLSEFCNLEGDAMNRGATMQAPKLDSDKSPECVPWGANPSVSSMDYMALDRRKTRLLSMVEEVNRCYRRYREKMRATEMSFEAVAGMGAAQVYTKLAMRAMSRHFRCLRDALVGQIRTLKKSMGESKDANGMLAAPGASKGDTPRLRVVDQCLRRQRAFQQYGGGAAAIESCPWRPQRGLPERAVTVLRSWLFEHFLHPYPNDVDKHILARQSGLSRSQVSNWFINARVRLWKPMIEEMYAEETIQHDDNGASGGKGGPSPADHHKNKLVAWTKVATIRDESCHRIGSTNSPSDCFIPSSLVAEGGQLRGYPCLHGDVGNGTVSLTLGLHQQRAFTSPTMIMQQQSSLMIGAEEEDVVLPYRNLMGSELLHDFAG